MAAITEQISSMVDKEVEVQYVHPHPRITRMACLWVGKSRWSRSRHHYKAYVATASHRNGTRCRDEKLAKWKCLSTGATAGLRSLDWKQIRRIVGLNPWGEQILYRLKLQAFSLYDRRNEKLGCPTLRVSIKLTLIYIMFSGHVQQRTNCVGYLLGGGGNSACLRRL
ncbi:reverse transcriptase [Phytophthora megakarya]|uniref:Reverse transcriptase n=1 Tax=Phytophthora megakarya TaxID=4795 RepID=A0A225W7G6_9STRA|nr:reverse transcriptase [Phytophthora megakarya]